MTFLLCKQIKLLTHWVGTVCYLKNKKFSKVKFLIRLKLNKNYAMKMYNLNIKSFTIEYNYAQKKFPWF